MRVLKEDKNVLVYSSGDLIYKEVFGRQTSGLHIWCSPEKMVSREVDALKRLKGLKGIQELVKRESATSFSSKKLEGKPITRQTRITRKYLNELKSLTQACEERGVYRIGENTDDFFILEDGSPGIVDFGNIILANDWLAQSAAVRKAVEIYRTRRFSELEKYF